MDFFERVAMTQAHAEARLEAMTATPEKKEEMLKRMREMNPLIDMLFKKSEKRVKE